MLFHVFSSSTSSWDSQQLDTGQLSSKAPPADNIFEVALSRRTSKS